MLSRIFLAINLPAETKNKLLEYKEKWPELPARWTKPENLHITLVFLGNTSEQELEEVKEATRKVASRYTSFSITLSRIQYGPDAKKPRMIWAVGKTSKQLQQLQKDLAKALSQTKEHAFSLHITLARIKEWEFRKIEPEERPIIEEEISLEIPVKTLDIMESKLKPKGPEYATIESISL